MLTELGLLLAMANPASAACTQAGGTLAIVRTDKGEKGMCTLPSGVVCEEWAFFRGECPAPPQATPSTPALPVRRRD